MPVSSPAPTPTASDQVPPVHPAARPARELLLDAARVLLHTDAWGDLRMVDVAATAGVSRQTLYNEFGCKQGLGAALVDQEIDTFVTGAQRVLAEAVERGNTDTPEALAATADWALRAAGRSPLLRAALTGCPERRLPEPAPGPAEVLRLLHQRLLHTLRRSLERAGQPGPDLDAACEAVVRLTVSYLIAPGTSADSTRHRLRAVGRMAQ